MIRFEQRVERACYVDGEQVVCSVCHHAQPASRTRQRLTRAARADENGACDICDDDLWQNGVEHAEVEIEYMTAKIF